MSRLCQGMAGHPPRSDRRGLTYPHIVRRSFGGRPRPRLSGRTSVRTSLGWTDCDAPRPVSMLLEPRTEPSAVSRALEMRWGFGETTADVLIRPEYTPKSNFALRFTLLALPCPCHKVNVVHPPLLTWHVMPHWVASLRPRRWAARTIRRTRKSMMPGRRSLLITGM